MKLPNGFGSITEIKNKNLRNRFRVRITVGKTQEGKPIIKLLKPKAFFKTYNEAYEALVKYHENPYDIDKFISVKELYEKWSKKYFKTLKPCQAYEQSQRPGPIAAQFILCRLWI